MFLYSFLDLTGSKFSSTDQGIEVFTSGKNGFSTVFPTFSTVSEDRSFHFHHGESTERGVGMKTRTRTIDKLLSQSTTQRLDAEYKTPSLTTETDTAIPSSSDRHNSVLSHSSSSGLSENSVRSTPSLAKAAEPLEPLENESSPPLLNSPLSMFAEDLSIDGLRKHIVALNLNVDNHLSKNPRGRSHRPNYSLSGHVSMTPNPRSEYKSPQPRKLGQQGSANGEDSFRKFDSFGYGRSQLRSKIMYDKPEEGDYPGLSTFVPSGLMTSHAFDTSIKQEETQGLKHINLNTMPPQSFMSQLGDDRNSQQGLNGGCDRYEFNPAPQLNGERGSLSGATAASYTNLQPMQQIILPNGVPAMVVPMMDVGQQQQLHQFQGGRVGCQMDQKYEAAAGGFAQKGIPFQRSFSLDSFGNRASMVSPVHINTNRVEKNMQRSRSFHGHQQRGSATSGTIPIETPLEQFTGKIFQMSREQNGCRYLQQKVDLEKEAACVTILHEVRPRLVQLMMDPFGNYLFQKLLEHLRPYQRLEVLQRVRTNIVHASLNIHGTRSVQKFIEVCGSGDGAPDYQQLQVLVECLAPYITKLSMDTNGNHVVQRCLQHMPPGVAQFVYDTVIRDVLVITRHRHGCCVFQRCIDAADEEGRRALVSQVIEHAVYLMQDPFGNYVVQYVLDNCRKEESDRLISQILGMLAQLSMQKFSSNVIEKCLLAAPNDIRAKMIAELSGSSKIRDLLHDQYANYVVQRALLVADDEQGMKLVRSIGPHIGDLGQFNPSCARRVAGRIIKRFPSLATDNTYSEFLQGSASNGLGKIKA